MNETAAMTREQLEDALLSVNRRFAEEVRARNECEALFTTLIESAQTGIILVDATGRIKFTNQRMAEMFGYSQDELINSSYPDLVHPDHRNMGQEMMQRLINADIDNVGTERHYLRKDGSDFWGYLSGRRHVDTAGGFISLVGHITDISDRILAEQALREKERYLQTIIDASPECIKLLARDGSLIMMNRSGLTMIEADSLEQVKGQCIYGLVVERDRSRFVELTEKVFNGGSGTLEFEAIGLHGTSVWLETHAVPFRNDNNQIIALMGITRDITHRKQAEENRLDLEKQLLHAQKLESLGVLAGGIAHDFNNILTAIIGNAELALMRLNPESPVLENLQRIEKAASRAADLARQMLAYSGKGKFVIETIDLNRLLEEMGHMLEVSISKKAVLRYNLTRPLPTVNVDATQIRQVVMNLVINASEAIGDKSGVIAITTGCMHCEDVYLKDAWLTDEIPEGLYVFLEVADTGCGMDRETQARIFDPFFTTKFTGRGLGMAAVMGIIRGHKGAIKVYSEERKGSSFKILLPAGDRPAEIFNSINDVDAWRGSGVIMLVDDEETVRAIGSEMLRELGFQVITATNGREALDLFKERTDIRVIILDLTMPHMDGEQCFRELRMLDQNIKVIMSSGYSEHEVGQRFAGKGLAGFIQKPYRLSELRAQLRNLQI